MSTEYYPWGGDFTVCSTTSCCAVVLLTIEYTPPQIVAIYGPLKTENIGIEKIVANVISNPHIRYVVVCGEDIRGHRSGSSLVCLHQYGIDDQHRIINAPGAIPYIENLSEEAITRFQNQVEIINLIGDTNQASITKAVTDATAKNPSSFGEPYIAIRMKHETQTLKDTRAIHSKIVIDYQGHVKKRGS